MGCWLLLGVQPSAAENWPNWRGPEYNGTSRETDLPVSWNATSGIAWKCTIPASGTSTPAIWGDAIFVTSHVDNQKLVLVKIDKKTGQIEWTRQVGTGEAPRAPVVGKQGEGRRHQKFHTMHNLASPSPTTDGRLVVTHFGNGDLAVYDFDGKQLWRRNLQEDHGKYSIWWGHANSPVICGDLVISVCMQDSLADLSGERSPSYVVAHDKQTGRQVWKTMRPTEAVAEPCDSYVTPLPWKVGNHTEVIVFGGLILDAYNPADGKQLWRMKDLVGNRVISGPVATDQMVYIVQGMRQPLLAVKLGGQGERNSSDVVWQYAKNTPDASTPVVWKDLLFYVSNNGIARCLDANSGTLRWEHRFPGEHRASPLAADGKIYFLNVKGLANVVAASPTYERLAENRLDDETLASPIVSDGRLFLRGRDALYCIGKK